MLTGIEIGHIDRRPVSFDDLYESVRLYSVFLPHLDESHVSSGAVTLTYLQQYITANSCRPELVDGVTRAFLLYLFGSTFFSNQRSTIRLGYLASLTMLDQLDKIDWGTAILGSLYSALDLYVLGDIREMQALWYILPFWYYEYTANMHRRMVEMASQVGEQFFPRMRRWEAIHYVPRAPVGVRHELMEARIQLDMRSRGNLIRTPWASHLAHLTDAGIITDAHPMTVAYTLSIRRVALLTPTFLPMWYLGERCAYQTSSDTRIPGDPLPCEDMFGRYRLIGSEYIQALRQAGWVDIGPFFIFGDYDSYWHRVSPRRLLCPDYARGINSDHLGPHMGAGRVQIPQVSFFPTPSQFSQPPMQIEPDCMFRAYDISGTVIEQPIVIPDDPDYPGVPSAGLYPPYQVWLLHS